MVGTFPLIGVSACYMRTEDFGFHRCAEKYVLAVPEPVGGLPVLIPALAEGCRPRALAARLDGLLLTGSASNVEPHLYDGEQSVEGTKHDPPRDATTLPLIRACIETGVPVLGLCRGLQEMNVAMGGSLIQRVFDQPDRFDHRMRRDVPHDARYRPAHPVRVRPGGMLARILGGTQEILVNSLHAQAVERPGPRVRIEAEAPDGIVEAISIADAPGFALGVQWHPEWPRPVGAVSHRIFTAFGDACRAFAAARSGAGEGLAAE